ncbi:tRNA lysidine(34) synthetase TilS [Emcibacter sp.]|uniref:tRNA lysidine(34) synthetase TilS n=1 Tax=Emcibacter sp. TaxID=1979954 RepID=UPI002AA75F57|nr:tRNA lysidine(34) synthetase TilS [Emcibacter sp.]
MDEPLHLTSEKFNVLMQGVPECDFSTGKFAVAVSGGADSMALALLLRDWCHEQQVDLVALTVNHGLRPEAETECRQVHAWLSSCGIPHEILTWQEDVPKSSIQENARKIRYRLLGKWCAEHQITHLFLAHHLNDQAETFMLRLARGSGVDGLAAMRKKSSFPVPIEDIEPGHLPVVCRPLLECGKEQLTAFLKAQAQDWIEDPSNQDLKHNRVQVREFLAGSRISGLTAERLAGTATRMQAVQDLLDRLTTSLWQEAVKVDPLGSAGVNVEKFLAGEREIALRLLARLLKVIAGAEFPPRFEKTQNLYERLAAGEAVDQTIGGCRVILQGQDTILMAREEAAVSDEKGVSAGDSLLWDGRFWLKIPVAGRLQKIGQAGWQSLARDRPELKDLPAAKYVFPTLPELLTEAGERMLPDLVETGKDNGFRAVFHIPADNFAEMI